MGSSSYPWPGPGSPGSMSTQATTASTSSWKRSSLTWSPAPWRDGPPGSSSPRPAGLPRRRSGFQATHRPLPPRNRRAPGEAGPPFTTPWQAAYFPPGAATLAYDSASPGRAEGAREGPEAGQHGRGRGDGAGEQPGARPGRVDRLDARSTTRSPGRTARTPAGVLPADAGDPPIRESGRATSRERGLDNV